MSTKETILNKIQILISNHFESPEKAFEFFDKNGDGKLTKKEIVKLTNPIKPFFEASRN